MNIAYDVLFYVFSKYLQKYVSLYFVNIYITDITICNIINIESDHIKYKCSIFIKI